MLKSSKLVQAPIISSIGGALCTAMLHVRPYDVTCELSRPPSLWTQPELEDKNELETLRKSQSYAQIDGI